MKFSDVPAAGITIRESANDGSDFTNPTADYRRLFLGEDGILHLKDSAGNVTDIGAGGGVAADAIWEAEGDIAYATGANAATVLTAGDEGDVLTLASGVPTWAAGVGGGNSTYVSAYSSPPGSPTAGDLWMPSDGHHDFLRYSGSVWVPYMQGVAGTLPDDTGFSWVNQDSSTITTTGPAHVLKVIAGENVGYHLRVKTAPATPYTVTAAFCILFMGGGYPGLGLFHRESSSGKLRFLNIFAEGSYGVHALGTDYWTDPDTYSARSGSTYQPGLSANLFWMRIEDDGADRKYWYSTTGRDWILNTSETRTTNLTANQVGWGARPHASYDGYVVLLSWQEA